MVIATGIARGAHLGRYDEPRVDLLGLVEAPEEGLDAPRVADVPDPSLRDLSHDGRRGWAAVPAENGALGDTGAHWWQISRGKPSLSVFSERSSPTQGRHNSYRRAP